MAKVAGISEASVRRIWKAHGLKPSRVPPFVAGLRSVAGVFFWHNEHAIALTFHPRTRTNDLIEVSKDLPANREAAPRYEEGSEWLLFLKKLNREVTGEQELHVVADVRQANLEPAVQQWLDRHRRVRLYLIPCGASWLVTLEQLLHLQDRQLITALLRELEERQRGEEKPRPFVWIAQPGTIGSAMPSPE
jgi:hypothetical protein